MSQLTNLLKNLTEIVELPAHSTMLIALLPKILRFAR